MTWSTDPSINRAFAKGETVKVRWEVLPYTQGTGLDIGCGDHKLWPNSIGIDRRGRGANMDGDVRDLRLTASGCMDYVYSSHCLEDLEDTEAVLAEWWRVLRVGGYLVLYLPHKDHYPNIGAKGANPAHKHDFVPGDIVKAMQAAAPDWALIENQVRAEGDEYSFLQVYAKRAPGKGQAAAPAWPEYARRCAVVRYGGFGDVLVGASTFPHLKAQGWHLTVYTGWKGNEILAHDPHVDHVIAHDFAALGNSGLQQLYAWLRTRYGKVVNLSGTFEGLLLADPRRDSFWWSHEMRHRYMNGNYLEAAHTAAGAPQEYRQKFHATAAELDRARAWRAGMPRLVALAVRGSGVNKFWPGAGEYARRMVEQHPDLHVAIVGEVGDAVFRAHPRIHVIGQDWAVRDALTLTLVADLVIGQETGLLHAAAFESMPKIVLLSHSSAENLTKHWVNASTLSGAVPCHPCHRLQADWRGCTEDKNTKAALCQAAIVPADAVKLSEQLLGIEQRRAA